MRKMATIRRIDDIRPIEKADAIECAIVGGWTVVVKKGEYKPGDIAVYCEIDSFIPTAIAPFLTKPGHYAKTFEGVEGERLRTVKLRGQLSQGLLLPMSLAFEKFDGSKFDEGQEFGEFFFVDNDMSELLGITKYEAPIPANLAGEVKGMFPSRIPKTDQERIQNLTVEFAQWLEKGTDMSWEITEKLDGSSMTVYFLDGEVGVCSRNLDLKRNPDNSLWKTAIANGLEEKLTAKGRNIAVQGELVGASIQGNMYKFNGQGFYVYDVYDIDAGKYFTPAERKAFTDEFKLQHCPVLAHSAKFLDTLGIKSVEHILRYAEGQSVLAPIGVEREGVVFKCNEQQLSFKAISNKFLLKEKE